MTIDSAKPRRIISDAICQVAAHVTSSQVEDLDADDLLKEALDLDATDLQNVAAEIFERSGIAIPECDYVHMESLGAFRSYLSERLAEPAG